MEMLIVVAILSVLVVLSVASWNQTIRRQEQERFARAFRWLLTEAREKALMENMAVRLVVDWEDKGSGTAKSVSWWQLPCMREGGPLSKETCPSTDCLGEEVSCVPVSKGKKLPVPLGIRLPATWGEFCFLAGTGGISVDCQEDIEISKWTRGFAYQEVHVEGRLPYKFYMSPVSTYVEVINCNAEDSTEVDRYTPSPC